MQKREPDSKLKRAVTPNLELDKSDNPVWDCFVYDDPIMTLKGLALEVYQLDRDGKLIQYEELKPDESRESPYSDVYTIRDIEWLPDYCFKDKHIYNAIDKSLRYLSDYLRHYYVMHSQELSYESVPSFNYKTINAYRKLLILVGEFIANNERDFYENVRT